MMLLELNLDLRVLNLDLDLNLDSLLHGQTTAYRVNLVLNK